MNYTFICQNGDTDAVYRVEKGLRVVIPAATPPQGVEAALLAKIANDPVMLARYRALLLIRSNDNMIPTIPYFQNVGMAVRLCIRNKTPLLEAVQTIMPTVQNPPELYANFVYMVQCGTGYTQQEIEDYAASVEVQRKLWEWFNIFSIGGSLQAIIPALMQE